MKFQPMFTLVASVSVVGVAVMIQVVQQTAMWHMTKVISKQTSHEPTKTIIEESQIRNHFHEAMHNVSLYW